MGEIGLWHTLTPAPSSGEGRLRARPGMGFVISAGRHMGNFNLAAPPRSLSQTLGEGPGVSEGSSRQGRTRANHAVAHHIGVEGLAVLKGRARPVDPRTGEQLP